MTFGQRPRLVEDDHAHVPHGLDGLAGADKDAVLGTDAAADHQGGGRGQPQRARAGDDQHRDGGDQCQRESVQVGVHPGQKTGRPFGHRPQHVREQKPGQEGKQGNAEDDGHEDRGHSVGEGLDGHFGALCLLDHTHYLGQEGVLADAAGPHVQQSVLVYGSSDHLVAWTLGDGHGFARGHRLVHGAFPLDDDTVGGDLFARSDDHHVAHLHLVNGHLSLAPLS